MEIDRTCFVADVFPRRRSGFPEASDGETPEIFMDMGIFQGGIGRLVAARLRRQLRCRYGFVAIHPQKIPVQPSLSPHQPLVCFWNDCRLARFRRGGAVLTLDWSNFSSRRLFFNHEMI